VQYLQAELRTVNETLATKQQESVHTLQDNARLLGDLSRAQGDLHQVQEEVRGLRPLKDELGFAQRRTEELGRRLVEQDAAVQQLSTFIYFWCCRKMRSACLQTKVLREFTYFDI